jgi:hypothetical protein
MVDPMGMNIDEKEPSREVCLRLMNAGIIEKRDLARDLSG